MSSAVREPPEIIEIDDDSSDDDVLVPLRNQASPATQTRLARSSPNVRIDNAPQTIPEIDEMFQTPPPRSGSPAGNHQPDEEDDQIGRALEIIRQYDRELNLQLHPHGTPANQYQLLAQQGTAMDPIPPNHRHNTVLTPPTTRREPSLLAGPEFDDYLDDDFIPNFLNNLNRRLSNTPAPRSQEHSQPTVVEFDIVLQQVFEIFPDICPDYVRTVYDERLASLPIVENLGEMVIVHIAEKGEKYPKKQPKRKRKTKTNDGVDAEEEDDEVEEYLNKSRDAPSHQDFMNARTILTRDFNTVPQRFIDDTLKEHRNHLAPAYCAIEEAVRAREEAPNSTFEPLKRRRTANMRPFEPSGSLKKEYDSVRKKITKENAIRERKKQDAVADAALDKQAFDEGQVKDCECCFTEMPFRKMVNCDGDTPHFFCFDCVVGHVKAQLDYQKYKIHCMDGGGCKAEFSRAAKLKCLDKETFSRLERVQQQTELREANVPGLETCPFCDFAAICLPIEEDKEFRCEHPDCKMVSCRLCRLKSHIPKSCEENKKEQGVEERHIVEEEMTKALIRTCPKCHVSILKTEGCNKIICTRCGTFICDVCSKDITRDGYNHFGPGKCAQYDQGAGGSRARENARVEQAEKTAKAKIRQENPNITDADLEIRFSDAVKQHQAKLGRHARPADRIDYMEQLFNNNEALHEIQGRLHRVHEIMNGIGNRLNVNNPGGVPPAAPGPAPAAAAVPPRRPHPAHANLPRIPNPLTAPRGAPPAAQTGPRLAQHPVLNQRFEPPNYPGFDRRRETPGPNERTQDRAARLQRERERDFDEVAAEHRRIHAAAEADAHARNAFGPPGANNIPWAAPPAATAWMGQQPGQAGYGRAGQELGGDLFPGVPQGGRRRRRTETFPDYW